MKIRLILTLIVLVFYFSCSKEIDYFLISNQNIGLLTDSTQVKDLKVLFANDSIKNYIGGDEFTGHINDIEIYEKTGNPLLVLTPYESLDSTSTIKMVKIIDERYKTSTKLTTKSTFKDIVSKHTISNIQNSLRNIIVSCNEINAFFIIDKKNLPNHFHNTVNKTITAQDIPPNAKIKHFYIQWRN